MSGSLKTNRSPSIKSEFSVQATLDAKTEKEKRPPPLSLRLSNGEREELERLANGQSLSGYIRQSIFENSISIKTIRTRKPPIQDYKMLARVLRALANADTISAITDIGKMDANLAPMSSELEIAVQRACTDIANMRQQLITALGLRSELD
ncbi:MAG: hypothetical protein JKY83_09750 [Rhizobiaceae bacterium]|nr:hypothetical protein [Rhizobiaceae bacterium]